MHVRLTEGVNLSTYRARWGRGRPSPDRIAKLRESLGWSPWRMIDLACDAGAERLVLNSIIADLAAPAGTGDDAGP